MNINYGQRQDPLETLATQAGCAYLNGEHMYRHQALAQQAFWQGQHTASNENIK
jgi:shikimate 5-dehydrogenase